MGGNWILSPANHTTTCADDGCARPARWFFESGGVGSYHCDRLPLQLILGPEAARAESLNARMAALLRRSVVLFSNHAWLEDHPPSVVIRTAWIDAMHAIDDDARALLAEYDAAQEGT